MPRVDGIRQSSPQWLRARVGRVTASRMGDVLAKTRDIHKESERRKKYRAELVLERKDGYAIRHYVTEEMQYGLDHQEDAREAYEIKMGAFLEPGGWWIHDEIPLLGASPDYLLDDGRGLVEIKVPSRMKHYDFIQDGKIDKDYEAQMNAQLACTGRDYCDFVSFDPRAKGYPKLRIQRFLRKDAEIRGMEAEVRQFLKEVDHAYQALSELNNEKVTMMARR